MYAVEFFLNEDVDSYVRDIWRGLKANGITSTMADIEELRPHVTVAVYNAELPIEQFVGRFESATESISKVDLKFDIVSVFPTSGTVFIPPTMNSRLFKIHRQYHNDLAEYNAFESGNGYNLPESWDPHCTLATRLNQDSLTKTLDYCLSKFKPMKGRIIEIGVVKLAFLEDKCISSKTIFSKVFN